ncbi:putative ABC transporter permease [Paludicola sp. MB14-C6]|uniref:putative ABC transporter permease n=1 Tax=Paludihabitans sp. MB14-C6 TaxID=3070656 RepID=UPI0027DD3D9E|nr:putative ABC transporter permease [Paludicola sp. MB14-C6]WMJ23090.1 putative ABC transporter permease [Paludicola sp. MB14-C6]
MQSVIDISLYLIIYSFLGWCCETVYCSFGTGHFVNRGFLNGPFCPVYGFGALLTLFGLQYFRNSVVLVFLGGVLLTSCLEYATSFAMEKLFHTKWWDYSNKRFNINGRVCLLNSTLFGMLCIFLKFELHPFVQKMVRSFPTDFKLGFLTALLLYFVVDFTITIYSVLGLNKRLKSIFDIKTELVKKYEVINMKLQLDQITQLLKDKNITDDLTIKLSEKIKSSNVWERRIVKAFPNSSNKKHNDLMTEWKETIKRRKQK